MTRKCPKCQDRNGPSLKSGHFVRLSDKKKLKRFRCKPCRITFSQATTQSCYRQKKRRLNPRVFEMLCSGVSQRRIARLLGISRTTVSRKFVFLARQTRDKNLKDLRSLKNIKEFQFDDLETIEHTKLKPVSVTMAVEKQSRRILAFEVSRMPAKGLIAKKAYKKYGYRHDERTFGRENLFKKLSPHISRFALIESDKSPHYPESVKRWFPHATHETTQGGRGCVTGQGELKNKQFDPLFSLNHTFAMLRANINRLFRKTWCTTKAIERLSDHIELYTYYHNRILIKDHT